MPQKRKSNATRKNASEPTARRSSPDASAGNASACTPEPGQRSQAGVGDTVSEKTAPVSTSRAAAAMNNEDTAVGTASFPDHSQVKKGKPARWPGRVAKRRRAPANTPKDPAEQTCESPNCSEPAGADGSTVTTEPAVKTAAKRRLVARGTPAKRAAAANASDPGEELTSPSRSNTSDGDATAGTAVMAEQRPVKAGKRGRAAARQGAKPQALSTHGQHATVDVSKAQGGRNAGSPVRPQSAHSGPAGAHVEDGERAGTKSSGKQAAKRGRPAKSSVAAAVAQELLHKKIFSLFRYRWRCMIHRVSHMLTESQLQALATHDQHGDILEAKTKGGRTSGSVIAPASVLQPYRSKNRLIGARGSGSGSEDVGLPQGGSPFKMQGKVRRRHSATFHDNRC
ncbi:hypothetical protein HPB50_028198 [Hyalomma asiaticum]|nr:hypothetical protein HPB50_028198 [Hyalomma asiaticum]